MAKRTGGKVRIDELVDHVMAELNEYNTYVSNVAIREAVKKTSAEAVRQLQATSPRRRGDYAGSWTNDRTNRPRKEQYAEIVYASAPEYRKTHLLEKGHRKREGGGSVPGKPHIAPVEQRLGEMVVKYLKGELQK